MSEEREQVPVFCFIGQIPSPVAGDTYARRTRELNIAAIRAHAARVTHRRKKQTKQGHYHVNLPKKRVDHRKGDVASSADEEGKKVWRSRRDVVASLNTEFLLDQTTRDPFNNESTRKLPLVVHDLMNFAYDQLFPRNLPGIPTSTVKTIMTSRRRAAMEDITEFHAQVSNAATMAFMVTSDQAKISVLTRIRLIHQNAAIEKIRQEMLEIRGPPTEIFIQRMLLLSTQGGDPLDTWGVQTHPESPIVKASNLKGYHRFRIIPQHHRALAHLVREKGGIQSITKVPGLAQKLQLSDVSTATREGRRPAFPLVNDLLESVAKVRFSLDDEAILFQTVLGAAMEPFLPILDQTLSNLFIQACLLTVALDQFTRGGKGRPLLHEIHLSAVVLQHRLYSAPALAEILPQYGEASRTDYLNEATRLVLMIYMDMVLWPLPWAVGVKPRLAGELRNILPHITGAPPYDFSPVEHSPLGYLGIYYLLMGGIAATYTSYRSWYATQFFQHVHPIFQTWEDFKDVIKRFLWWDYVMEPPAFAFWTESFAAGLPKSVTGPEILTADLPVRQKEPCLDPLSDASYRYQRQLYIDALSMSNVASCDQS
ncbi:hypothetical protein PV08_04318 [Exophiala spinifera]|uniref:Uncharacterized protein n=1 Tax=Exophiala spinifera TaxID=91928 RepID=A0A0D1ZWR9_9EURO|nr:uncharacterized protein PV08_04318 [Exophiala spinifera]KIW17127.1 hypothetical protein PV08_04318 [Exophiala spinifera]